MTAAGMVVMVTAVIVAFAVYWSLALFIRSRVFIPAVVLAVPLLAAALACALPFAWIAYRLPRVVKLRCWKCHWTGRYRTPTDKGRKG